MAITDHETLREQGWSAPLDESPIDLPKGWHHGAVRHTGGGIHCRTWFSVPDPSDIDSGEHYYEVGYNAEFWGVSLEKWENDGERTYFAGVIANREADEHTDETCAEIARDLMENVDTLDDNS